MVLWIAPLRVVDLERGETKNIGGPFPPFSGPIENTFIKSKLGYSFVPFMYPFI